MNILFEDSKHSIFVLYGIPKSLRSNDLRKIFEDLTEKETFLCFHYRHRPSTVAIYEDFNLNLKLEENVCFLILSKSQKNIFEEICNSNLIEKVHLKASEFDAFSVLDSQKKELFFKLEEFNPPSYLPNGNVGTSSKTLKKFISLCKVPTSVLKALKVDQKRIFASIQYDYTELNNVSVMPPEYAEGEEWEKHIQLHNDVDEQGRTKERLYENEKEVVWEKGSSGLVYYTDAQYWHQRDGKTDFDEDAVDDWDVDMAIYTQPLVADRDAVELYDMREIEAAKRGIDFSLTKHSVNKKFNCSNPKAHKFESNFGSRTLLKYGWKKGEPIGRSGLIEPIEEIFRKPLDKSGLGFKKFSPIISTNKHHKSNDVKISTIYDDIDEEDDTPLESAEPTRMKYRKKTIAILCKSGLSINL